MDGKTFIAEKNPLYNQILPVTKRFLIASLLPPTSQTFFNYHPFFPARHWSTTSYMRPLRRAGSSASLWWTADPAWRAGRPWDVWSKEALAAPTSLSQLSLTSSQRQKHVYISSSFFSVDVLMFHTFVSDLVGVKGFPRCSCSAGQWLRYVSCGDISDCSGCKSLQRTCAGVLWDLQVLWEGADGFLRVKWTRYEIYNQWFVMMSAKDLRNLFFINPFQMTPMTSLWHEEGKGS